MYINGTQKLNSWFSTYNHCTLGVAYLEILVSKVIRIAKCILTVMIKLLIEKSKEWAMSPGLKTHNSITSVNASPIIHLSLWY